MFRSRGLSLLLQWDPLRYAFGARTLGGAEIRNDLAVRVDQPHQEACENGVHVLFVTRDPLVEGVFPFLLAEAHAHRDLVVELDLALRHERYRAPGRRARVIADQETRHRAPQDRHIDLLGGELARDG